MNYELIVWMVIFGFLLGRFLGYLEMRHYNKHSVNGHDLVNKEMAEKYGEDWL